MPPGTLPLVLVALVILAYLGYVWFSPKPPPEPDAAWTTIQQQGVLKIGVDPSQPPFVADDGKGNLSGLDVALANELADKWGVKVQWVYTGYDGLYDALNGGQFDLILSALPYNPTKTEDVNFSHSYANLGPVLVVRGEDTTTNDLSALTGRQVAVELGTAGDAAARKWQRRLNLDVREFNTGGEALHALQVNQVAAALVDPISLFDFQRAEADTGAKSWRVVGKPLTDELYVIAVRKDSPFLLQQINAVIDGLKRDGSLEELQQKWF